MLNLIKHSLALKDKKKIFLVFLPNLKEPFRKPASAVSKLFLNCTLCYDIKNSSIHKGNENMSACRQYVRTDTNKGKEDSKQRRYRKAKWNTIVPFSEIVITVHYPLGYYS